MGDLFDAALGDPSHSPLAALQAYRHAPPAAAQLDPFQVCCAAAWPHVTSGQTAWRVEGLSDYATWHDVVDPEPAMVAAGHSCSDHTSLYIRLSVACETCLRWLTKGFTILCGLVCRARMHTQPHTCMLAPGHVATLGGGGQTPLLPSLLPSRNGPNALRRRAHARGARPNGCNLSRRRTHSEP